MLASVAAGQTGTPVPQRLSPPLGQRLGGPGSVPLGGEGAMPVRTAPTGNAPAPLPQRNSTFQDLAARLDGTVEDDDPS